jgi:hypothetical protein
MVISGVMIPSSSKRGYLVLWSRPTTLRYFCPGNLASLNTTEDCDVSVHIIARYPAIGHCFDFKCKTTLIVYVRVGNVKGTIDAKTSILNTVIVPDQGAKPMQQVAAACIMMTGPHPPLMLFEAQVGW